MIAFALLIAACGGSSGNTASNSPEASPSPSKEATISSVDACKLVTATDATSAVGMAMTNMAASSGVSIPGACIYASADGSTSVFVLAQTYPDVNTAQSVSPDQIAAAMNGQYGVTNAKSVAGIGDKAVEYTASSSGGTGVAIFVFKSNVVLMIILSPSTDGSKVEQLARTALGNLH